jgi:hypothetical protein
VTLRTQLSRIGLAATALAIAAAAVAPAGAADKPVPCGGAYLLTDKAGDTNFDPSGQGLPGSSAPDNTDITGLFFNYESGTLTANIEIANLTKDVPAPSDSQAGVWYYVFYNYKGKDRFVKAINRSGGDIEYRSGYLDSESVPGFIVYATDPEPLKGSFHEGAKGVVSIEIPAALGGKEGEKLGLASATVDYIQGPDDANGVNNRIDQAPDDGTPPNGKNYIVTACTGTTGPTGPAGSTVLPFKVSKSIGKAKKAKKGRSISVKVRSTAPITSLKAKLKNASGTGATLATGKLAQLDGAAKLKLKFKRTLAKGSYKLIASGVVDGTRLTAKKTVKLK